MRSVPGPGTPITENGDRINPSWWTYFAQLLGPQAISSITPSGSPFVYQAQYNGSLVIVGGTVSSVQYSRDNITYISVGQTAGMLPVSGGDYLKITYTVAPTLSFIPT